MLGRRSPVQAIRALRLLRVHGRQIAPPARDPLPDGDAVAGFQCGVIIERVNIATGNATLRPLTVLATPSGP